MIAPRSLPGDDMTQPRIDTHIQLSDQRRLAYAEYGGPEGTPVFLFHGLPGSRLAWGYLPDHPFPLGLRIIAPDRPGTADQILSAIALCWAGQTTSPS